MGKRELIIIAVFAVLAAAVYQITAPPAAPGERGFSIGRIIEGMRRGVRGNRASAETTNKVARGVEADVTELRVALLRGSITVVGEDRSDVEAEVVARSNGFDDAEAARLARETVLTFERTGAILAATVQFPEAGRQTARLTLRIPARLQVRIDNNSGTLDVRNVSAVELALARGDTTIRDVRGRVSGAHRGGDLTIADAGTVRLTLRGSDVQLERIRGEAIVTHQAGELKAAAIVGPLEFETSAVDVTFEGSDKTTGMLRINASGGSIDIRGLSTESRIDARNAEIEVAIDRAVPIAIHSSGGEPVTLSAPPDGFRLDAVARDGRITATPENLDVRWGLARSGEAGEEQRMQGDVNGGGPLITVRAQGEIRLRSREKP